MKILLLEYFTFLHKSQYGLCTNDPVMFLQCIRFDVTPPATCNIIVITDVVQTSGRCWRRDWTFVRKTQYVHKLSTRNTNRFRAYPSWRSIVVNWSDRRANHYSHLTIRALYELYEKKNAQFPTKQKTKLLLVSISAGLRIVNTPKSPDNGSPGVVCLRVARTADYS